MRRLLGQTEKRKGKTYYQLTKNFKKYIKRQFRMSFGGIDNRINVIENQNDT